MKNKPLWAPDERKLPNEFYEELRDYTEEENREKERIRKEGDFLIIDEQRYIPSQKNPQALLVCDKGHHEILEFPLCPHDKINNSLEKYVNNLKIETNLIKGYAVPYLIVDWAINPENSELWVRCKQDLNIKACEHVCITYQDEYYIHFIDTFYPYYEENKDGDQRFYWPWETSTQFSKNF